MFRVEDSVDGERLAVVGGAGQLPLPLSVGRFALGRQVRAHVRENGATGLLRTVDDAGGMQTWWAGRPGVSVAAAIDAWSEAAAGGTAKPGIAPEDPVAVALDERVYFAERRGGLVVEETVLAGAKAGARLEAWQAEGRGIRTFGAGRQKEAFAAAGPWEIPPFDIRGFRFGRPLGVLARNGLYHPLFGLALAASTVVPAVGWLYSGQAQEAAAAARAAMRASQLAADEMQADFGGGALLERFAGLVAADPVVALHRDGLAQVAYAPAESVLTIRGGRTEGYPAAARAYARAVGGAFTLTGDSWEIVQGVGSLPAYGPLDGVSIDGLASAVYSVGERSRATVRTGMRADYGATAEIGFTLLLSSPNAYDLARLGGGLAGRPVALDSVACKYVAWTMDECRIEVRAKGISG